MRARLSKLRAAWRAALLVAVAVPISACGQGSGTFAASHTPTGSKTIFVALGGYELPGFPASEPGEDWAQLFYGQALSRRSTLYDLLSSTGPYVEGMNDGEVTQALGLHPGLVAVWVGMPDLLGGMPAATFEQDLEQLLGDLVRGRTEVLVANLLPIYLFSPYRTCEAQPAACGLPSGVLPPPAQLMNTVSSYDQAVSAAASHNRASVVNLTGVFAKRLGPSNQAGSVALVDQSDLGLTASGEQLVAQAFESTYSARHVTGLSGG